MNEKCPYCEGEMEKGVINGDRYVLKWMPGDYNGIVKSMIAKDKVKLTTLDENYITAYYCRKCQKMIFDVK